MEANSFVWLFCSHSLNIQIPLILILSSIFPHFRLVSRKYFHIILIWCGYTSFKDERHKPLQTEKRRKKMCARVKTWSVKMTKKQDISHRCEKLFVLFRLSIHSRMPHIASNHHVCLMFWTLDFSFPPHTHSLFFSPTRHIIYDFLIWIYSLFVRAHCSLWGFTVSHSQLTICDVSVAKLGWARQQCWRGKRESWKSKKTTHFSFCMEREWMCRVDWLKSRERWWKWDELDKHPPNFHFFLCCENIHWIYTHIGKAVYERFFHHTSQWTRFNLSFPAAAESREKFSRVSLLSPPQGEAMDAAMHGTRYRTQECKNFITKHDESFPCACKRRRAAVWSFEN